MTGAPPLIIVVSINVNNPHSRAKKIISDQFRIFYDFNFGFMLIWYIFPEISRFKSITSITVTFTIRQSHVITSRTHHAGCSLRVGVSIVHPQSISYSLWQLQRYQSSSLFITLPLDGSWNRIQQFNFNCFWDVSIIVKFYLYRKFLT